jgi:hypothetical protein
VECFWVWFESSETAHDKDCGTDGYDWDHVGGMRDAFGKCGERGVTCVKV